MEKKELMVKFHNYNEILDLMDKIDHYRSLNSPKCHEIDSLEMELIDSHKKLEKLHEILLNGNAISQTEDEIKKLLKIIKAREKELEIAYCDFDEIKTNLRDLKYDYQVALGIGALKLIESNQDLRSSLKNEVRKLIKEEHTKINQIKSIDAMDYYIDKHFLMELRIARESGLNGKLNTDK